MPILCASVFSPLVNTSISYDSTCFNRLIFPVEIIWINEVQNQAHYQALVNVRVFKWVAIMLARDTELHSFVSPSSCSLAVFRQSCSSQSCYSPLWTLRPMTSGRIPLVDHLGTAPSQGNVVVLVILSTVTVPSLSATMFSFSAQHQMEKDHFSPTDRGKMFATP